MDNVYVENKDYIHSLFDPLNKRVSVDEIYLTALLKRQTEVENKCRKLEDKIKFLEEENNKLKNFNNLPFYKKIFKKYGNI